MGTISPTQIYKKLSRKITSKYMNIIVKQKFSLKEYFHNGGIMSKKMLMNFL